MAPQDTWAELMSILGILFSREEWGIIRRATTTIWEREHPARPGVSPDDIKFQ
jgi:hypothetical protein